MTITLLIKLLLAHFIGDFSLQPTSWVKDKIEKKAKSKYLYLHIATHAILVSIALGFQHWEIVALVVISHYLIDLLKLSLSIDINRTTMFFIDQALHLMVIALSVHLLYPYIELSLIQSPKLWLLILAILVVTKVAAMVMQEIMQAWSNEIKMENSLPKAGKYIGILERLFVFGFIVIGQWSAIGFLLAAKSVFRFGDLNKDKNLKLTEYVLIGTLLSFGIAIVIGLLYTYLEKNI